MISKLAIILLGLCLSTLPARADTIDAASPSFADVNCRVNGGAGCSGPVAASGDTVTNSSRNRDVDRHHNSKQGHHNSRRGKDEHRSDK